MDYYKKNMLKSIIMILVFLFGVILQFIGHAQESKIGLLIQIISLVIILTVLFVYNRRNK